MHASKLPVAVVGMTGAGKSEVSKILVESHGFHPVYFGQVVLDEIAARHLPAGPDSERLVREQLRLDEGMDVMAARSLPLIRTALTANRRVCIDGLYSGAEWQLLSRETGLITLAVHAPRWLRKRRLAARPERPLTSHEVDARDLAEVEKIDKATPIALADSHIVNDGSRDELELKVLACIATLTDIAAARLDKVWPG